MSVGGLLLGDSRFPAGGHAFSGGIEAAVATGSVSDLPALEVFLRGRLRTAGLVAAGLAAAACAGPRPRNVKHAGPKGRNGAPGESGAIVGDDFWGELDAEADARTPSPAQREASRRQGRALLRSALVAWPEAPRLAELAASVRVAGVLASGRGIGNSGSRADRTVDAARREYRGGPHHPVALGAAADAAGCSPAEAARIAAYQSVAGPVSAAVRLLALDPMRATAVLAGLTTEIDHVAAQGASHADQPLDELPGPSAPALDLLAETHIRAEVRLFES